MTICPVCDREFPAKEGKDCCSNACRTKKHAALRAYGASMVKEGRVSLKHVLRLHEACTALRGQKKDEAA